MKRYYNVDELAARLEGEFGGCALTKSDFFRIVRSCWYGRDPICSTKNPAVAAAVISTVCGTIAVADGDRIQIQLDYDIGGLDPNEVRIRAEAAARAAEAMCRRQPPTVENRNSEVTDG